MSELFNSIPEPWREHLIHKSKEIGEIEIYLKGNSFIPSFDQIFTALKLPPWEIKVVIIGQDPYPNLFFANGLAFSVPKSVEVIPPSLKNIFLEMRSDIGVTNTSGDLTPWREQGVLLLNRILTLSPGSSLSHRLIGWQEITNEIIKVVSPYDPVAILWGEKAKEMAHYFNPKKTIYSSHPSPLSARRSFFGSKPFSKCNKLLIDCNKIPIDWQV